jgi:hypothetical protein
VTETPRPSRPGSATPPAPLLQPRAAVALAFLAATVASALLYGLAIARDGPLWVVPLAGIGAGAATLAWARVRLSAWALGMLAAVVGVFVGTALAVWVANLLSATAT